MLFSKAGTYVFNDYDLRATLEMQTVKLKEEIENDVRLKAIENEADYITSKIEKHKVKPLGFIVEKMSVSTSEQMIPSEIFPNNFAVREGESYPKPVLSFHLPFEGDKTLLKCVPSSRILWTEKVLLENNEIVFEMINFSNSVDEIKQARDRIIDNLKKQSENVNNQVNQHNDNLEKIIKEAIKNSNEKINKSLEFLKELGTPLKETNLN
jgi:hypothetical protein